MAKMKALLAGSVMAAGALAGVAQAEWTGNLGITNNYLFRGISVAAPAVSGGLDWSSDTTGFYAGTWLSNGGAETEVDFYLGYEFGLGSASLDLGAIAYTFPGEPEGAGSTADGSNEIYLGVNGSKWNVYAWYNFGVTGDDIEEDEFAYIEGNLALGAWDLHAGVVIGIGDAFDGDCEDVMGYSSNGGGANACEDGSVDLSVAYNIGAFSIGASVKTSDNDNADTERPEFYVKYGKEFAVK